MAERIGRRGVLKLAGAALATQVISNPVGACSQANDQQEVVASDDWANTHDRVWLGSKYWANPMEDWRIRNGKAECLSNNGNRSVHSLVQQLVEQTQAFEVSVEVRKVEMGDADGGASIRLGVASEINEYRSNCFAHSQGIDAGVIDDQVFLAGTRKN